MPEVRKAEKTRTGVITVPGAHKAGVALVEAGMTDRKGPEAAGKCDQITLILPNLVSILCLSVSYKHI